MESTNLEKNNNNPKFNKEDTYNDHFKKDVDSKDNSELMSTPHKANESVDGNETASECNRIISPVYISQQQTGRTGPEQTFDKPDTDSEPETDVYNFTEDQQRAMMELLAQKQEDADLLDEDPPEYNVKGRIEQLNAELANDPTPVEKNREHRVGFKTEIVDLVAPPPPDYSDDESQANSNKGELQNSLSTTTQKPSTSNSDKEETDGNKEHVNDTDKRQFVIERDGQFSLLSASELSPSERAILISEDFREKKTEKQSENEKIKKALSVRSHSAASQVLPRPPSRPRPNTATSGPRRNIYWPQSAQAKPVVQSINPNSGLEHFNYNSPYAMTHEQKLEAREKARKFEEERREKEKKNREEAEEKRRENDVAFQAWLQKKREEDRKRHGAEGERQKSEQERRLENEDAYRAWLKEKKAQVKKDKLLKKRQQQEKVEGSFLRSPEECEEAFKEWLKRKNAAPKKHKFLEKQTNRMYRVHVMQSRKIQALIKALKESQICRY